MRVFSYKQNLLKFLVIHVRDICNCKCDWLAESAEQLIFQFIMKQPCLVFCRRASHCKRAQNIVTFSNACSDISCREEHQQRDTRCAYQSHVRADRHPVVAELCTEHRESKRSANLN